MPLCAHYCLANKKRKEREKREEREARKKPVK